MIQNTEILIRSLVVAVALSSVALAPLPAQAAETATDVTERLNEFSQRLALTDDQIEAARPIVRHSMEQRRALLAQYNVAFGDDSFDRLSRREKGEVLRGLREIGNAAEDEWRKVLTDEQFAEFGRIKAEARERARAALAQSRMDSGR